MDGAGGLAMRAGKPDALGMIELDIDAALGPVFEQRLDLPWGRQPKQTLIVPGDFQGGIGDGGGDLVHQGACPTQPFVNH